MDKKMLKVLLVLVWTFNDASYGKKKLTVNKSKKQI